MPSRQLVYRGGNPPHPLTALLFTVMVTVEQANGLEDYIKA
jgi:hypothetical protein